MKNLYSPCTCEGFDIYLCRHKKAGVLKGNLDKKEIVSLRNKTNRDIKEIEKKIKEMTEVYINKTSEIMLNLGNRLLYENHQTRFFNNNASKQLDLLISSNLNEIKYYQSLKANAKNFLGYLHNLNEDPVCAKILGKIIEVSRKKSVGSFPPISAFPEYGRRNTFHENLEEPRLFFGLSPGGIVVYDIRSEKVIQKIENKLGLTRQATIYNINDTKIIIIDSPSPQTTELCLKYSMSLSTRSVKAIPSGNFRKTSCPFLFDYKLYFFGSLETNLSASSKSEYFDLSSETWKIIAGLPVKSARISCASKDFSIYLAGNDFQKIQIYDPFKNTYSVSHEYSITKIANTYVFLISLNQVYFFSNKGIYSVFPDCLELVHHQSMTSNFGYLVQYKIHNSIAYLLLSSSRVFRFDPNSKKGSLVEIIGILEMQ